MAIENDEDFRRLAQMVRDGAIQGPARDRAMAQLRDYDSARQQAPQQGSAPTQVPVQQRAFSTRPMSVVGTRSNALLAAADLGLSMATGAVAQPVSGIAGIIGGLAGLMPGGESPIEKAARWQEHVEEALTYSPKSEAAKKLLSIVGPVAEAVTRWADDAIYAVSGGVPEIATAVKTTVYGVPAAMGFRAPLRAAREAGKATETLRGLDATLKRDYNIDVRDPSTIPPATAARAQALTPTKEKAVGFDKLLEDLRKAEADSLAEKNAAWGVLEGPRGELRMDARAAHARLTETLARLEREGADIHTGKLRKISDQVAALVTGNRRIATGGGVRIPGGNRYVPDSLTNTRTLEAGDVVPVGGRSVRASERPRYLEQLSEDNSIKLDDLLRLRARVNFLIGNKNPKKGWSPTQRALIDFNSSLREVIDDQLVAMARQAGPDGNPLPGEVLAMWRAADKAAAKHRTLFNEDRAIRKLLLKGTDAEQAYQVIFGASAIGARPQSVALIRKLKEILGPEHSAITDIRKAAIRDIMLPALSDTPDLAQLSRNLDRALSKNKALLKELGIDTRTLEQLERMARTSAAIQVHGPVKLDKRFLIGTVTSLLFNNQLARAGARRNVISRALQRQMRVGELTPDEVRAMLIGRDNVPIIEKSKPELVTWLAAGTAADAANYGDDEED